MLCEDKSRIEAEIVPTHSSTRFLKVLAVIPGDEQNRSSMVFARRQMAALAKQGVETKTFYLSSRQSPRIVLQEMLRFRRFIRDFDPDIVHAHYGTVTAIFCAIGTLRPLVISFRGSDLNPSSDYGLLRSLIGRLFSQLSVLRAKHIICVSQQLKDRVWLRSRAASIIFDGVDLSILDRSQEIKHVKCSAGI